MSKRQLFKNSQASLASFWSSILLIVALCLVLASCDGHFLSLDCVGSNGFCSSLQPTPTNAPTLQATARTIIAGQPLVADPLNKPDRYNWPIGSTCNFHDGAYYMQYSGKSAGDYVCASGKLKYLNVAIALNVTLFRGDAAGIIFRGSQDLNNYYAFMVSEAQFSLEVIKGGSIHQIVPTPSPLIHGMGQTNRLLVIARGDNFQLFINDSFVCEVQDNTLSTPGSIGVNLVYNPLGEASFSSLDIYQV